MFRCTEAHDGGAHVVGVALAVVVRMGRCQVQGDVLPVVYLLFGRKVNGDLSGLPLKLWSENNLLWQQFPRSQG